MESSQGQFMVRAMTSFITGISQSDIRAIPANWRWFWW